MTDVRKRFWLTVLAIPVTLVILWVGVFELAVLAAIFFSEQLGSGTESTRLLLDALFSFVFMLLTYYVLYLVPGINARAASVVCASAYFLFWGFESGFFFDGLNPMYPAWYEINMALNDFVAAISAYILARYRRRNLSAQ